MKKLSVCLLCLVSNVLPSVAKSPPNDGFMLQDFLGRTWRNEFVEFPLSESQQKAAAAGQTLVGAEGKPVLYQVVPSGSKQPPGRIAFLADLDPFETRAYRFADSAIKPQTDLKIEETDKLIRISNNLVGISIRKKLAESDGPIEAIRLQSGTWVGGSQIIGTQKMKSYSAEVVARGPVFCEVVCRAGLGEQRAWELRFRVQANEPVVLVEEKYSLGATSAFTLNLSRDFSPDHVLYRDGVHLGKTATWKIVAGDKNSAFILEPWLHWASSERQGQWFALY